MWKISLNPWNFTPKLRSEMCDNQSQYNIPIKRTDHSWNFFFNISIDVSLEITVLFIFPG